MTERQEQQLPADITAGMDKADLLRQELLKEISRLHRLSARGILALVLFLLVSIFAWWGYLFLPAPETVSAYLGKPPPARIISLALLLYTFSAIILSLSRLAFGTEHRSSLGHAGYLTVFYLFYYFGKSLEENYWAVFCAGITILGVESYRIRVFCAESIARKKGDIEYLNRTGRVPPLE